IAVQGDRDLLPVGRYVRVVGDRRIAVQTDGVAYLVEQDAAGLRGETTGGGAKNAAGYPRGRDGPAMRALARARGADNRQRLMLVGRSDGRTGGPSVEATKGWTLSVGSYIWCPDSKCLYAVVEERGRDNIYRIDLPSFRRSLALGGGGVNTDVQVMPDGRGLLYLHQSNTQPNEIWLAGRQLTHHTDAALEALDLRPLDEF